MDERNSVGASADADQALVASDQANLRCLGPLGFDPSRWEGRLLIRCAGFNCDHGPGICTADPEYQRYIAWKYTPPPAPRQMQMQWHTEAGEVLFYFPSNLSARDVADVRELVDLCVKGMERRASAIDARQRQDREDGPDPQGESAVAATSGETPNGGSHG